MTHVTCSDFPDLVVSCCDSCHDSHELMGATMIWGSIAGTEKEYEVCCRVAELLEEKGIIKDTEMANVFEDNKPLVIDDRGKDYTDTLSGVCGRSAIILEGGRTGTLTLAEMRQVAQDLENTAEVLRKMIQNVEKLDKEQNSQD